MIHCQKCQSPNVVSNKLDEIYAARTLQFAQAAQNFEHRRLGELSKLAVLAIKTIDALLKDCRCTDCGHKFDV